jgi:hypothetical protein
VNVDEEIGGRLRVAGYRDGGGGYCIQFGIRYERQLRLDKTLISKAPGTLFLPPAAKTLFIKRALDSQKFFINGSLSP